MKLNTKALALTSGILWGLCMLGMTLANLASASYGRQFLDLMSSIYPGYHATRSIGEVIVGTLYGAVDGFIGGAIIAWFYNHLGASSEGQSILLKTATKA